MPVRGYSPHQALTQIPCALLSRCCSFRSSSPDIAAGNARRAVPIHETRLASLETIVPKWPSKDVLNSSMQIPVGCATLYLLFFFLSPLSTFKFFPSSILPPL